VHAERCVAVPSAAVGADLAGLQVEQDNAARRDGLDRAAGSDNAMNGRCRFA
jgi:hypothetical protein